MKWKASWTFTITGLFVIILLILLVSLTLTNGLKNQEIREINGQARYIVDNENNLETNLAVCLSQKNVLLYTSKLCYHCRTQESYFAEDYKYLKIVEVSDGVNIISEKYIDKGITGTPTWIINGKQYVGVMDNYKIGKLAGCIK